MKIKNILYNKYVRCIHPKKSVSGQVCGPLPNIFKDEPDVYGCYYIRFTEDDIVRIEETVNGVFMWLKDDPLKVSREGAKMPGNWDYHYRVPWCCRGIVEKVTGTRDWGKTVVELTDGVSQRDELIKALQLELQCLATGW